MMLSLLSLLPIHFLAAVGDACTPKGGGFFALPHWWKYLSFQINDLNQCAPVFNFPGDIWAVVLAVIDMLLRLAGIVAVLSIVIAGVTYITSAGSSEKTTSARKRIQNSLIGLGIVIVASAVVSFIGNSLT